MTPARSPSVGLVHDYLLVMRGAERTFAAMASCWPGTPVYTLLYDGRATGAAFEGHAVRTSFLQRLPIRQRGFRRLLPLLPLAAQRLPARDHELIVSSSSAFAHGVRLPEGTLHVCYCHSPFRYAWHERDRAIREVPSPLRPLVATTLNRIRDWDVAASRSVNHYIANSELTRRRIANFWGREASVIHPPVQVERFQVGTPEDFFLVVGELVHHKRVELALEAAQRAGRAIKVVGTGPDERRLRRLYTSGADFLGRVSDEELAALYARARALVVPAVEEFGITAVESQAAGRPVLAVDAGGAQETVIGGETGVLVRPGDPGELAEAMKHVDFERFSSERMIENARRFSTTSFKRRLVDEVARVSG